MSIIELKLLATALVFTNMWMFFRIMEGYWIPKWIKRRWNAFWQRQWDKFKSKFHWLFKEEVRPQKPLEDFVGKSHFKMPHVIAAEQEQKRKEILASGKSVEDDDVVFNVEEELVSKRKFEQVPDEQLDEVFSDTRMEDVAKYFEEEKAETKADGNSFEDIDKAVRIAKAPLRNKEDVQHAIKVFSDMEGNELFEKLTNSPELSKRIRMILTLCLEGIDEVKEIKTSKPEPYKAKRPKVPQSFKDFNVLEYL